jgi:heme-binding protein
MIMEKNGMRKPWQKLLFVCLLLIALIQFVRPSMSNPPVDSTREITAIHHATHVIASTLERSCNDCHSNRTVWPWYSQVAPVSWLVAHDVNEGRNALNFSEWRLYGPERAQKLLGEICETVREGEMPVKQYTLLHPRARLTPSDVHSLCNLTGLKEGEREERAHD